MEETLGVGGQEKRGQEKRGWKAGEIRKKHFNTFCGQKMHKASTNKKGVMGTGIKGYRESRQTCDKLRCSHVTCLQHATTIVGAPMLNVYSVVIKRMIVHLKSKRPSWHINSCQVCHRLVLCIGVISQESKHGNDPFWSNQQFQFFCLCHLGLLDVLWQNVGNILSKLRQLSHSCIL